MNIVRQIGGMAWQLWQDFEWFQPERRLEDREIARFDLLSSLARKSGERMANLGW